MWHLLGLKAALLSQDIPLAQQLAHKLAAPSWRKQADAANTSLLNNMGLLFRRLKVYAFAMEAYQCSLDYEQKNRAVVLHNMAVVARKSGDLQKALTLLKQARELMTKPEHIAAYYNNVANIYSDLGDSDKALEAFHQAFLRHGMTRNVRGQVRTGLNAVETLISTRDWNGFARYFPVVDNAVSQLDNKGYSAMWVWQQAVVKSLQGHVLSDEEVNELMSLLPHLSMQMRRVRKYAALMSLHVSFLQTPGIPPLDADKGYALWQTLKAVWCQKAPVESAA